MRMAAMANLIHNNIREENKEVANVLKRIFSVARIREYRLDT